MAQVKSACSMAFHRNRCHLAVLYSLRQDMSLSRCLERCRSSCGTQASIGLTTLKEGFTVCNLAILTARLNLVAGVGFAPAIFWV